MDLVLGQKYYVFGMETVLLTCEKKILVWKRNSTAFFFFYRRNYRKGLLGILGAFTSTFILKDKEYLSYT